MKYGTMLIPKETITKGKNLETLTFKFFIRNAQGEGLPEYKGLMEKPPTEEEEDEDETDLGPKYQYSITDKNLHERLALMLGFFHEELMKRLNKDHGDDSYFDETPAYVFNFYQLCVIIQAHNIWNTFREAALKTPFALNEEFHEVDWAFPEELESPWDTYMKEAE